MYLKRYRGVTVRDALALAREELGPEALVLATRLVPVGGWRGLMGRREVEVTIAAEREVSRSRPAPQAIRQPASDAQAHVVARLCAAGLDARLARSVADALSRPQRRGASARTLRQALAEQLEELAAGPERAAPIEVFVGPPGSGKTTTIAKLAAQERARHGNRFGLVAADTFRVGAVEQLRIYADIIGTSFATARTPGDLATVIERSRQPILVDTAGRSRPDGKTRELLELLGERSDVRTHLVMPASTNPKAVERVLDGFEPRLPDRVVLTKLDEATSVSALLGMIRERRLSLSYLGTGQRVPEDLERATAPVLAACVLGEAPFMEGQPA